MVYLETTKDFSLESFVIYSMWQCIIIMLDNCVLIVAVLKSDKKNIPICGDFKLIVNSASKVDRYLIPKIDDLVATLSVVWCS